MISLVLGGLGFLGSFLVDELIKDGEVDVVDNLTTNVLSPEESPATRVFTEGLDTFIKREGLQKYDEVYHCASVAGPVRVMQMAGQFELDIVLDSYIVLEALKQTPKTRAILVSTSEVYGRDGSFTEEMELTIPMAKVSGRLGYAVAKSLTEIIAINMHRANLGIRVNLVRPFNISGSRQSDIGGFVIPRFIKQAAINEPLTVYIPGTQIRSFTHAIDIATGMILACRHNKFGQIYNLGEPKNTTTILELANRIITLMGSKSEAKLFDPKELHGPRFEEAFDKIPNPDKAKSELGWEAKYSLDDIIHEAIKWFKKTNSQR